MKDFFKFLPATTAGARLQLRHRLRKRQASHIRFAYLATLLGGDAKQVTRTLATIDDAGEAEAVRTAARQALDGYTAQLLAARNEDLLVAQADAERLADAVSTELAALVEMGFNPSQALLEIDADTLADTRRSHERITPHGEQMAEVAALVEQTSKQLRTAASYSSWYESRRYAPASTVSSATGILSSRHTRTEYPATGQAVREIAQTVHAVEALLDRADRELEKLAACRAGRGTGLPAHVQALQDAAERLSAEQASRAELREEFDTRVAELAQRRL